MTSNAPSALPTPVTPARYTVRIDHHRRDPIDYRFDQRSTTWLIDLAEVPQLPAGLRWLCRFSAADHLGDPQADLSTNVNRFLAEHEVPAASRILMLANPRMLGYVFNPLTVFYCYDAHGRLTHTVAEVRNTYGGRHSYLFSTDSAGRAETDKLFYVSPFYPVDGRYTMQLPEPGAELRLTIRLNRDGDRPFTASMTGQRDGARSSLWRALRSPLGTRAVMFGIKRHGITLFLRGLRPYDRNGTTVSQAEVPVSHAAKPSELSEAR